MKKELRVKVWEKFDKHCAYCGCKLEYKDMQVDHKFPQAKEHWLKSEGMMIGTGSKGLNNINDFSNLMPSCRLCNYHKDSFTVEEFKKQLIMKIDRVKNSNVRLLEQYGIIEFNREPVVFYFEKTKAI